ncbi:MAG: AAA family ATPase [Terriglobales bacterium]
MIGVPGSGKSSFLAHHGIAAVSTDALRELLFGDADDQRAPAQVFSLLRRIVASRLEARVPRTFVDATNLNAAARKPLVRLAVEAGDPVFAIWLDTGVDECLTRNQGRTRVVGDDVVRRMARTLRPATTAEGIAHLYRVRGSAGEWVY